MNNGFVNGRSITLSGVVNIFMLISLIVGGGVFVETRYALASDVDEVLQAVKATRCEVIKGRIADLRTSILMQGGNTQTRLDWQELQDSKIKVCVDNTREEYPI